MATFKGTGIVKWKDRVLVNFTEHNGSFSTLDEMTIQRLELLGFERVKETISHPEPTKTAPSEPSQESEPEQSEAAQQPAEQTPEQPEPGANKPEKTNAGRRTRKGGRK